MKSLDLAYVLGIVNLPIYQEQIQKRLLSTTNTASTSIQKSIHRLFKAKSKRMRSALLIAVVATQNKPIDESVITCCAAIELIHLGSLVHDDIIDNAKSRWNIETINSREGINHAILVGDYLFAKACELGASQGAEIGQLMASTITELINGESQEMADQFNSNRTLLSMQKVIQAKTASLISCACQVGGLCVRLKGQELEKLTSYGEAFGMSFQLIDDLLDLLSSTELSGKSIGNDIRGGIYTMPLILSLGGSNKTSTSTFLSKYNETSYSVLVNSLLNDGSIEKTIAEIKKFNKIATKAISSLDNNNMSSGLADLPDNYLNWCLKYLIDQKYRSTISNMLI